MNTEQYVQAVYALVLGQAGLSADTRRKLQAIKLVYGAGQAGLRGVTYYRRWQNGEPEPIPFVEVCAFGQESRCQLAGTTVHELAHVLAGWNAGHGPEWKAACDLLGLRAAKAAGTNYHWASLQPWLREAIRALPEPIDGNPVSLGSVPMLGGPQRLKPCGAGVGTRGGKSRGKGSGSRLRLWQCECEPPVKARVASNSFNARCLCCESVFVQQ